MANWQRTLNLKDVWDTKEVLLIAKTISDRLRGLPPVGNEHIDYQREELVEQFADLADDTSSDRDDFDELMSNLYDWADTPLDREWNGKKVCWVATF